MKKIALSIRIDEDILAIIRDQAKRRRVTVSAIIHEILVGAVLGKQGNAQ